MGIGAGIVLAVIGAILLTGAIAIPESWPVDPGALGFIFFVAGLVAIGLAIYLNRRGNGSGTGSGTGTGTDWNNQP